MPYIDHIDRVKFEKAITILVKELDPDKPGELNYVFSSVIDRLIRLKSQPSYTKYNQAIGVLECVKQEFYRRAVVPYEDKKKLQSGEVFYTEGDDK